MKLIVMRCKSLIWTMTLSICVVVILSACNLDEPVEVAGFTLKTDEQVVYQNQTGQICTAIENAGYVMPYGPPLGWYDFNMTQSHWIIDGPIGTLLSVPYGNPYVFVLVDWHIPADLNALPDAVSQDTVDTLAEEAKNICRIIQQEAQSNGIGSVNVRIRLWDLWVGLELDYGAGPQLEPTSDCEQLVGLYIAKSIGLNPEAQTPGLCPSLYVPN